MEKLLEIKSKLEEAEKEESRLKAKEEVLLSELEEMGFDSLKEAEDFVKRTTKELGVKKTELEDKIKKFGEKYAGILE